MSIQAMDSSRSFRVILIKPSHYDDDGYVIQWVRSAIPSNTLAVLYSLIADAGQRGVLGADVSIDITAIDETNERVRTDNIIAELKRHGGFGFVGLVGVQSNQFPRALDIARPLRSAGIQVAIGGFHVSGSVAMLPETQADVQTAIDMGLSLYIGEAEEHIDEVLRDAANGRLKPRYDYINALPSLESKPPPLLPKENIARVLKRFSSFDAGRGCPYQCSFCTIINVQGRKSRRRSPDDIERALREHWARDIKRIFITDDNFARNKDWEALLDRMIELRERENMRFNLIIQVDTLCHRLPNFVEKAARAGVDYVFIGLENINPANLMAAKKRQNKITEYRQMLLAWKQSGVITVAGYILGFAADTVESVRQDIEIIKNELPIDILEFFWLTPLPGSEDHKTMWQQAEWMDPDMNKYDLEHVVSNHPKMSREECEQVYRSAWSTYYTRDHMRTILRRGAACNLHLTWLLELLVAFSVAVPLENVHPLQSGYFRVKYRRDRRPSFPIESRWKFYGSFYLAHIYKAALMAAQWIYVAAVTLFVALNPRRTSYTDRAMTPVDEGDVNVLQLFTHNAGARDAVEHSRKIAALSR